MQSITDTLDKARAAAFHATLALTDPSPANGDPLPPFWHQIYFWDPQPPAALGSDGHPKTGEGLIPNLGLPQRMWAGGKLLFHAPVLIGRPATKTTTIDKIAQKTGRTGALGFVTLKHEIFQNDRLCITEKQDIVYREAPDARKDLPTQAARLDEEVCETASFNSTLLFRYSALTFNGHRIHYDLDYCTHQEGYSGLVVHGPLLAQLLMSLAERRLGSLKSFSFRATSAVMHYETVALCWADGDLWVRGPDDRLCMTAKAT